MTSGGIYGRITGIRDDKVTVEISDKVRVKVSRGNIAGVVKGDVLTNNCRQTNHCRLKNRKGSVRISF